MTSRERITTVLRGGIPDRVPLLDICFWPETLERWRREGFPHAANPYDYFGLDRNGGFGWDGSPGFPTETLEETEEYCIQRSVFGATLKSWKKSYATPCHLEWFVKGWDEWRQMKKRIVPGPERIAAGAIEGTRRLQEAGWWVALQPTEPGWFVLEEALGFEGTLAGMMEQPELIHGMVNHYTDFVLTMADLSVAQGLQPDALWFFSDLCYRSGMLFSPAAYREYLMEPHKRVAQWCHDRGIPLLLHCDGDVREFIPLLLEAGFDAIQPLEARCGNDVRELKALYGDRITLFGNMSVDRMSGTPEECADEILSKLKVAKVGGRYLYHSDHSVPPTVPFENYALAIRLLKEHGVY